MISLADRPTDSFRDVLSENVCTNFRWRGRDGIRDLSRAVKRILNNNETRKQTLSTSAGDVGTSKLPFYSPMWYVWLRSTLLLGTARHRRSVMIVVGICLALGITRVLSIECQLIFENTACTSSTQTGKTRGSGISNTSRYAFAASQLPGSLDKRACSSLPFLHDIHL